ncbi:uncharacterized protein [Amphiura filiformis]|uniref:uncharacterized protein isoform X2 n=1 Tax=Amphiura filiformis TaxID=82378 RepID=UPI003B21A147
MDAISRPCFGLPVTSWLCLIICAILLAPVKCITAESTTTIDPTTGLPHSQTISINDDASGGTTEASNVGATENPAGTDAVTKGTTVNLAGIEAVTTGATENPATGGSTSKAITEGTTENLTTGGSETVTDLVTEKSTTDGIEEVVTTNPATDGTEAGTEGVTENPKIGAAKEVTEAATDKPKAVTENVTNNLANGDTEVVTDSKGPANKKAKIANNGPEAAHVVSTDNQHTPTTKSESIASQHSTLKTESKLKTNPTTKRLTTTHSQMINSTTSSGNTTNPPPLSPVAIANVTAEDITPQSVTIIWEQIDKDNNETYRLVGYKLSPMLEVQSKIADLYIDGSNKSGIHRLTQNNLIHHTYYMFCVVPVNLENEQHPEITDGSNTNTTDCFFFETPYNPLNLKAVVALGFGGLIVVIFFAVMISCKCYERTKEEQLEEKKFLVDRLKQMKRHKRKKNYGSDKELISGYKIADDEESDFESVSLDAKSVASRDEYDVELDKMSMPDDSSDTGYLLDGK